MIVSNEERERLRSILSELAKKEQESRRIQISGPVFGVEEILSVLEVLLAGRLTMGPKTYEFEKLFASYIGTKHAIAVNSGSSANLIALTVLSSTHLPTEMRIKPGDEVITPAVTWPTTCFPIIQIGAIPVFVDVDRETFCIDPSEIEKAVSDKTKAILLVHMLGHPADMKWILEIAEDNNLLVIEDACEALGAECYGRKVGAFGDMATFSFFAAHHITTGEGGMITTNEELFASLARSIRAFGRACACPVCKVSIDPNYYCPLRHLSEVDSLGDYDRRYIFTSIGFSLKLTEIQAALGIIQMQKLENFLKVRRENAEHVIKSLEPYSNFLELPVEKKWAKHAWFGIAITVREDAPFSRSEFVKYLEERGIETRPIMAGNIIDQPCMKGINFRKVGELPITNMVKSNSFFIGCYPGISKEKREYQIEVLTSFLEKYTNR